MGKYEALGLLWSPSKNKFIQPGETIELEDEIAKILLRKRVIRPARYIPKKRARKKIVIDKEKGNGTNN